MVKPSEINALIQLLDDDDQEVFKHVHQKLKSFGLQVIPALEEIEISQLPPVTHERLEEIIRQIYYESLMDDWKAYLQSDYNDLTMGFLLISRYYYPALKANDIEKKINKIKQSIWLELNHNQTPLEQIQIFNQIFFSHLEFQCVQTSADIKDYCLNEILENKKGSAIAIGILYQVVAHDLTIPVYGVNLTRHFALSFCKRAILDFSQQENLEKEVMFYINPVNKGNIFSRNEIKDYLDKLKIEHQLQYFTPADNRSILKELLNYHIEIAQHQQDSNTVNELSYLLQLL